MYISRRTLLAGLSLTFIELAAKAAPNSNIVLRAEQSLKRFKPDFKNEASIYTYNISNSNVLAKEPLVSGSLIRLKKGDPMSVRLENTLPSPTSLHWYGVRGPNSMDGVTGLTQTPVKQGEVFDYTFTPPDSGLFWYHPLHKGSSAEQQDRGLYGLLIIEEPDAPMVDQDIGVVIDDWNLSSEGEIIPDQSSSDSIAQGGRLGNFLTVNGVAAPQPILAAPNGRIRLRFLNATRARICPLKFENVQAHVIAIDGQACDPFDPLRRTVVMSPGSRFDVIVDIPMEEHVTGQIGISLGSVLPLLSIRSSGKKSEKKTSTAETCG